MPGIAGIVSRQAPLDRPSKIIESMIRIGRLTDIQYQHDDLALPNAAILQTRTGLLSSTNSQPAHDSQRQLFLFLEGEIFNVPELRRNDLAITHHSTTCEILLANYVKHGDEFIKQLDGEFNVVILDASSNRVTIFSDHLASYPMYFIEDNGCLLFSSEKKYILPFLTTSPRLDPVGLLQIFAHRYNLDERTFIEGLRRMMPGTRLVYDADKFSANEYSTLAFSVPEKIPKTSQLVSHWGEILKTATQRRIQGKDRLLLSLSGGLDSRAIAAAIPRDFRPINARTGGPDDSADVVTATQISEILNFVHLHENTTNEFFSEILAPIAWRTECETHFSNASSISGHRTAKALGDFIAGGWLGDATSGAHIPPELLLETNRTKFIDRAFRRHLLFDQHWLGHVFSADFLQRHYPALRECFHDSFPNIQGHSNIQLYELWDLCQRQRRQTTSSMPIDSYMFEKVRPFYDKAYIDFTLSLPTRLRFGQTLYQCMILDIGPELRSIPSANTALRLRNTIVGNLTNKARTLSTLTAKRATRRLFPKADSCTEPQGGDNSAARIRRDSTFRSLIEDSLASGNLENSVFNRTGIHSLLNEHYDGQCDHSYLLGYVATFAVGLPYFMNRTLECPAGAQPAAIQSRTD